MRVHASALWIILLVAAGCGQPDRVKVEGLLKGASLPPLPSSATNISYHLWKGIFTAEVCARFDISATDMRAFISNAPVLHQAKPEVFDASRHYLSATGYANNRYLTTTGAVNETSDRYFVRHPKWPAWFDPVLESSGRVYSYYPHWNVVLDEDKNIVWLNTGD